MLVCVQQVVPDFLEYKMSDQFLGHSVVNGLIRFTSVSQIVAFDKTMEGGCPRRWYFQKVVGKKEPETVAMARGKDYAKSLEHYLKYGEDVLLPELRVAKQLFPKPGSDLSVEEPLGDIIAAVRLRDILLKTDDASNVALLAVEIERQAGLVAAGIPLTGAADFRHRRGEYVDVDGTIRPEDPGMRVVEIGDLKTTSRINSHTTRSGEVLPGYAKTTEQILAHPQMVGYARHSIYRHPDTTHVRLSHVYCQRRNGMFAAKRTGLLTVDEVRRRWSRIEIVAREMEQVARAEKSQDVPYNLDACNSYHRECPHMSYCERPKGTIADLFQIRLGEGDKMEASLFDLVKPQNGTSAPGATSFSAPPTLPSSPPASAGAAVVQGGLFAQVAGVSAAPPAVPAPPPMSDAERQVAIAVEKALLLGQNAAVSFGFCPGCGAALSSANAIRMPGGLVVHNACPSQSAAPPVIPPVPSIGAINPADRPPIDPIAEAQALSPEAIAEIVNPELRDKAEKHAAEAAARAAAEEAAKPAAERKTGGRCAASGQRIELTQEQIMRRRPVPVCPGCGKELGKKIADDWFTQDFKAMTIKSHNLPKADPAAVSTAPVVPPPATPPALPAAAAPPALPAPMVTVAPPALPPTIASPPVLPPQITQAAVPPLLTSMVTTLSALLPPTLSAAVLPTTKSEGVVLYIDVSFDKGAQPTSLDAWYQDILRTLENHYQLADIRMAPKDHEIGYGKWKAALSVAVRANVPAPGEYVLRGAATSELIQTTIEALEPLCSRVIRGAR